MCIRDRGSDITFTVTRTKTSGSDLPTTVYLSTTHSTTGGNDFVSLDKQALAFKADELSKKVIVKTNTDSTIEGTEYFWLDLFKTKAQADSEDYHTFDKGYIKDNTAAANAISNYSYSITTTAREEVGAVTEGSPIEFKITRTKESGDDARSTVYIRTEDSSATSSDYKSLVPTEVTFNEDETEKIINDGFVKVPESPGLGITLNEDAVEKHLNVKPGGWGGQGEAMDIYPKGAFEPTDEWDRLDSHDRTWS